MPSPPNQLRDARTTAGPTQHALAERVGAARERITCWEARTGQPQVGTAIRLAAALNTRVEALLLARTRYLPTSRPGAADTALGATHQNAHPDEHVGSYADR